MNMAKGTQDQNVQGNWQGAPTAAPTGMLGQMPQAGQMPQQMMQPQGQGYAYPWMQAGKWGGVNGTQAMPTAMPAPAAPAGTQPGMVDPMMTMGMPTMPSWGG